MPNTWRNPGRCAICGTPDDFDHDQKPHGFEVAPDPVAASYVELTVAIVRIDERVARLEAMLGEFLKAFRAYLDSLEEDDVTKH